MTEPLKIRVLLKERAPNGVTCTRVRQETAPARGRNFMLQARRRTGDRSGRSRIAVTTKMRT
jgi:hypothetical protein